MRRLATLVYALTALALLAPSGAAAAGPPIVNIAPPNAATAAPTTSVEVQFTCPRFETSYDGQKDWTSYWVVFANNPTLTPDGEFAAPYEIHLEEATPINPSEDICRAFLTEPFTLTPGTYYWMAERINCDVESCREAGPIGSFTIVAPPPPPPPPPPAPPASPPAKAPVVEAAKYTAYVACGLNRNAKASSSCAKKQKIGAFFRSTKPVAYKVCVKSPDGKNVCAKKRRAEGGVLYVDKVSVGIPGRYKVTWTVEGRTIVRHVHRRD